MSWILQIDTALDRASVSLAHNGELIEALANGVKKDHASFLHPAIEELLKKAGISLKDLKAIGVVTGPGSYTGLRVSLAAAKGLCYAMRLPLISLNTLNLMAASALAELEQQGNYGTMLVCPMIDARRMDVFTALYNNKLEEKLEPQAMVLDEYSFANWLLIHTLCFFGTGAAKWQQICKSQNAVFINTEVNNLVMSTLIYKRFVQNKFADTTYVVPEYLKDFYSQNLG